MKITLLNDTLNQPVDLLLDVAGARGPKVDLLHLRLVELPHGPQVLGLEQQDRYRPSSPKRRPSVGIWGRINNNIVAHSLAFN